MKYTKDNFTEAKGTTFIFIDDDEQLIGSEQYGKEYSALIAAADKNIGYTIKDINSDDPDGYLWCFDIHGAGKEFGLELARDRAKVVDNMSIISELNRVKGVVRFSDFARLAAGNWGNTGAGNCPF